MGAVNGSELVAKFPFSRTHTYHTVIFIMLLYFPKNDNSTPMRERMAQQKIPNILFIKFIYVYFILN